MSQECMRSPAGDGLGSRRAWFRRPLSFMLLVFSCCVASFTCTCMAYHVPVLTQEACSLCIVVFCPQSSPCALLKAR